jgi:type I restriction enzyme R subunit
MERGMTVAGGDRLGKTIVFAKNHDHAEFIAQRFNANYPHFMGEFARVIDFKVEYAQSLIDDFSYPEKAPHIAISVDMLDTGIDIPEVVNLVFFKLVRSKTKFWQMVGRGTRLRPDLFGTGKDKTCFYIFDYCQNLEFFSQDVATTDGALGESLGKRLFKARLEVIVALDRKRGGRLIRRAAEAKAPYGDAATEEEVRHDMAELLRGQVAAMNVQNFIVRPRRRLVEKYAKHEVWDALTDEDVIELARDVAGLPTERVDDDVEAKRFDLLMLRLQLTLLHAEPGFERMRDQVRSIAGLLEEKSSIPMVSEQMALIQEIQTDEYWQDVTTPMLEMARKRLRALVKLIEKTRRQIVFSDFEDELGDDTPVELPGFGGGADFARFRAKARQFLVEHEDHLTIHKLRWNQPLTATDLTGLEHIMLEAGIGTPADIERAKEESRGLGLFIRSLVGMDREAAKQAFGDFLSGGTSSANQIEFINLAINYLTEHGIMDARLLYESPFTDISPQGPEGIFSSAQVDDLVSVLTEIGRRAAA